MAFPSEVSRIDAGGSNVASVNHNCTMPATVNAGELLLVFMAIESGAGIAEFTGIPSGWSKLAHAYNSSQNTNAVLFGKVADGSEDGAVVNFVTVGSHRFTAHSAVISGWLGALASAISASTDATGGLSGTNDPPALTPAFGGEDILWYAFKARNDVNTSDTITYPSGYSGGLYAADGTTTATKTSAATAYLQSAVASEDPGAFGGTGGVCMTIAIQPADTRPIKGLAYDPIEGALYILRGAT